VLEASLAPSTQAQYSSPLNRWHSFCTEKGIDPTQGTASHLLNFLTAWHGEGASYGTLNSARAAISLISVENFSADKLISRFFEALYRLQPPKPRYAFTWDAQRLLDHVEQLWPLDGIPLAVLSRRLVALLAITTAKRVDELFKIELPNIRQTAAGFEIGISALIKTSRPGAPPPLLSLPFFPQNPKLCVPTTLLRYLEATRSLRGDIRQLFIATVPPYKAVGKETLRRWIKTTLRDAGIEAPFSSHSTRHAAVSTAFRNGVDIHTIYQTANWSARSRVLAAHYHRPIQERSFAHAVLQAPPSATNPSVVNSL